MVAAFAGIVVTGARISVKGPFRDATDQLPSFSISISVFVNNRSYGGEGGGQTQLGPVPTWAHQPDRL